MGKGDTPRRPGPACDYLDQHIKITSEDERDDKVWDVAPVFSIEQPDKDGDGNCQRRACKLDDGGEIRIHRQSVQNALRVPVHGTSKWNDRQRSDDSYRGHHEPLVFPRGQALYFVSLFQLCHSPVQLTAILVQI